jgi:hypothetical protein
MKSNSTIISYRSLLRNLKKFRKESKGFKPFVLEALQSDLEKFSFAERIPKKSKEFDKFISTAFREGTLDDYYHFISLLPKLNRFYWAAAQISDSQISKNNPEEVVQLFMKIMRIFGPDDSDKYKNYGINQINNFQQSLKLRFEGDKTRPLANFSLGTAVKLLTSIDYLYKRDGLGGIFGRNLKAMEFRDNIFLTSMINTLPISLRKKLGFEARLVSDDGYIRIKPLKSKFKKVKTQIIHQSKLPKSNPSSKSPSFNPQLLPKVWVKVDTNGSLSILEVQYDEWDKFLKATLDGRIIDWKLNCQHQVFMFNNATKARNSYVGEVFDKTNLEKKTFEPCLISFHRVPCLFSDSPISQQDFIEIQLYVKKNGIRQTARFVPLYQFSQCVFEFSHKRMLTKTPLDFPGMKDKLDQVDPFAIAVKLANARSDYSQIEPEKSFWNCISQYFRSKIIKAKVVTPEFFQKLKKSKQKRKEAKKKKLAARKEIKEPETKPNK